MASSTVSAADNLLPSVSVASSASWYTFLFSAIHDGALLSTAAAVKNVKDVMTVSTVSAIVPHSLIQTKRLTRRSDGHSIEIMRRAASVPNNALNGRA